MKEHICSDCGFKGTQYEVYDYGSSRLCTECLFMHETEAEKLERAEERLCVIQNTKLSILKKIRAWHSQGLLLPTIIKNLEASLN